MGFDLSYVLKMSAFKNENPSPTVALEIRTRQRLQLQVLTSTGDVALRTLLDDVVSPELTTNPFTVPPRVLAMPALRQLCIRNLLASLEIDGFVCERVAPEIEKYVVQVAAAYGVGGFGVVAEIEVTKADVFGQQEACSLLGLKNVK